MNNSFDSKSYSEYPKSFNKLNTIVDPTYDQIVIKPPKKNITHGRITKRIVIDSRDRNIDLFPCTENYQIYLTDEFKDVVSVELVKAMVPNSNYIINKYNNLIYFQEIEGVVLKATIPTGDYSADDLITAIETVLNDIGDSTYKVYIDLPQQKFRISSDLSGGDHIFVLMFYGGKEKYGDLERIKYPDNSIGKRLGYGATDYMYVFGTATNASNSPYVYGGNGANFAKDLVVGDSFRFESDNTVYIIKTIISPTELETTVNIINSHQNVKLISGAHRAINKYDLSSDSYVIVDISELQRLDGFNKTVTDSFCIIPLVSCHNTKNFFLIGTMGVSKEIKYFNPPNPRLMKLTIKFKSYDGNLFDFNGADNFLELEITALNQAGKYNTNND